MKHFIKEAILAATSLLMRRHAVLLPRESRDETAILNLDAPYRVENGLLAIDLGDKGTGQLSVELLGYEGTFPTRLLWSGANAEYGGPCTLTLDLERGRVDLGGRELGRFPLPLPGRRLALRLTLAGADGAVRSRLTGHYLPGKGLTVGAEYFHGENYLDHDSQSAGDNLHIIDLARRFQARGPALEVGCATGGALATLSAAGLPAFGLDISEWAVGQARAGGHDAWVCDVENEPLPAGVLAKAPFGTLVLWAVFEHFRQPFAVLEKLGAILRPGAVLILNTTNAESLSHTLFGRHWEGYYDRTHLGVDLVSASSLREGLPRLGWRIEQLTSERVWDMAADPTHATLREWWSIDARFRKLLVEKDLGDLITLVAVRQ